jgi:TPR repeat protein
VPQDYAQAVAWYRKAADQGFAPAQYNLGLYYYDGQGVPQDYAEAYFWEDLAASGKLEGVENGTPDSNAAKMRDEAAAHLNRELLTKAQERARKWFEAHTSPAKAQ